MQIIVLQCHLKKKQIPIWSWSFTGLNIKALDYEHDVYDCPPSYVSFKNYSHIIKEPISAKSQRSSIMGYNICCQ